MLNEFLGFLVGQQTEKVSRLAKKQREKTEKWSFEETENGASEKSYTAWL